MTTSKQRKGFGGQWVEIFTPGKHNSNKGIEYDIDAAFLEAVVANFNVAHHEPPAVVGHPKEDAPAYGWVCGLRVGDQGKLEAQFHDNDAQFEAMVESGKFKKRSAAFYLDATSAPGGRVPALRHVGFLGAQPPAVKGLKNIHFNESDAVTFEDLTFSEGESSMDNKEMDTVVETLWDKLKNHLGLSDKKNPEQQASFNEADVKRLVGDAVKDATSGFSETVKQLEAKNKDLETRVERQANSTTRTELIAFCERQGAAKLPPALMKMGVVEFMETLANVPGEQKVTTISFSEEAGVKKEVRTESTPLKWFQDFITNLGPMVAFGEQFGNLNAGGAEMSVADPARVAQVRAAAGLPAPSTAGGDK